MCFSAGLSLTTLSLYNILWMCDYNTVKHTLKVFSETLLCVCRRLGLAGCGGNESNRPPPLSRSSALLRPPLAQVIRPALLQQLIQSGLALTGPAGEDHTSHHNHSAIHSWPDVPGLHYWQSSLSDPRRRSKTQIHICTLPWPVTYAIKILQLHCTGTALPTSF